MNEKRKKFKQVKFEKTKKLSIEGMEIVSFISGVSSGVYTMPFVISVRCWASKFGFKKFFRREMHLNIFEVRELKEELEKVLEYHKEYYKKPQH